MTTSTQETIWTDGEVERLLLACLVGGKPQLEDDIHAFTGWAHRARLEAAMVALVLEGRALVDVEGMAGGKDFAMRLSTVAERTEFRERAAKSA